MRRSCELPVPIDAQRFLLDPYLATGNDLPGMLSERADALVESLAHGLAGVVRIFWRWWRGVASALYHKRGASALRIRNADQVLTARPTASTIPADVRIVLRSPAS